MRLTTFRRLLAPPLAVCLSLLAPVACTEESDGVRKNICGTWIGSPADGVDRSPWYLDVTGRPPAAPVRAYVEVPRVQTVSIVNVRVSDDCSRGAHVEVSDRRVLSVVPEVSAGDGAAVVVLVTPRRAGRSRLTAARPGRPPVTVTFVVRTTRQRGA